MAYYFNEPSCIFSEYLIAPGYSSAECTPTNVSLETPLVKSRKGKEGPEFFLNIPMVSAIMQSISGEKTACVLAGEGGISFIYGSQTIESEVAMVRRIKATKAGFVYSDSNIHPDATLQGVLDLKDETGHATMVVTEDGALEGKLLDIITSRDYRTSRMDPSTKVVDFMTPFGKLIYSNKGCTLNEADDMIWELKLNQLPIIDENQYLKALVLRKDYDSHKEHPNELLDDRKWHIVGAGINTRDYEGRIPALTEVGADVLCVDSSKGFSEWQARTLKWVRKKYGDNVKVGAGNVVDAEDFRFLAEAGTGFVKIGIGGGSVCITREQKGIGCGQATTTIDVAKMCDEYYEETGIYVPICSGGGIVHDYHVTLALAMGVDFVMLGRYLSRFEESPTKKVTTNGAYMKEYWGEGSARARNWQRHDMGGSKELSFVEGVDSYVPYAGALKGNADLTLGKVKRTMCNCGTLTTEELQKNAKTTLVSSASIVEGGAHDVVMKDNTLDTKVK